MLSLGTQDIGVPNLAAIELKSNRADASILDLLQKTPVAKFVGIFMKTFLQASPKFLVARVQFLPFEVVSPVSYFPPTFAFRYPIPDGKA